MAAGKLIGSDEIGVRVGKVVNQYKVAKHFELTIEDHAFNFVRKLEAIAAEAALDGIYIIRTSLSATQMDARLTACATTSRSLRSSARSARSRRST